MAAAEPPPAILYVDTSALLKLLVREAESSAIERELLTWSELATSVIAEVELPRAVARQDASASIVRMRLSRDDGCGLS
jgi:predicted nucleic acid-binding protein